MIALFVFLLIAGVLMWFLRGKIDPTIYNLIIGLIVIVAVVWLLSLLGLFTLPAAFRIGKSG